MVCERVMCNNNSILLKNKRPLKRKIQPFSPCPSCEFEKILILLLNENFKYL